MILPIFILNIENDDDRDFMATVYTNNYKLMYYIAMKYTGNINDTDDVISDTCIKLISKIDLLRTMDDNSISAYINVATANNARSLYRKRQTRKEYLDDGEILKNVSDDENSPDAAIIRECTIQEMRAAFSELMEADQTALQMKYILECTDKEIADALGVKENSVRMRLKRARERLYEKLKNNIYI